MECGTGHGGVVMVPLEIIVSAESPLLMGPRWWQTLHPPGDPSPALWLLSRASGGTGREQRGHRGAGSRLSGKSLRLHLSGR